MPDERPQPLAPAVAPEERRPADEDPAADAAEGPRGGGWLRAGWLLAVAALLLAAAAPVGLVAAERALLALAAGLVAYGGLARSWRGVALARVEALELGLVAAALLASRALTSPYDRTLAAGCALAALAFLRLRGLLARQPRRLALAAGCVAVGLGLLGLERSWRLPAGAGAIPGYDTALAAPLAGLGDARLARARDEPPLAYLRRANEAVHQALVHSAAFDVQPGEAWLLWLVSRLPGAELADLTAPALVVRRGGGFCHQVAIVLAEVASRNGIHAVPFSLEGHVVTLVEVDGSRYLFDPDLGVGGVRYPRAGESADAFVRELTERYRERLEPDLGAEAAGEMARAVAACAATLEVNVAYVRNRGMERLQVALVRAGSGAPWALLGLGLGLGLARRRGSRAAPLARPHPPTPPS